MSTTISLYDQAQLAEAAYADFFANPGNPFLALTTGEGKFSASQATEFVSHWRFVDQVTINGVGVNYCQ